MIETKHTVTTIDGQRIVLQKDGPQVWEVQIMIACIDPETGHHGNSWESPRSAHVTREPLERAGLLPISKDSIVKEKADTTDDLIRQIFEHLGVSFE